jgi:diaminopimelate epimerase
MPALHIPFTKMQGAGNDFIVVDNRFFHFSERDLQAIARRFCARRTGVGADGLLALDDPEQAGADYRMHYLNADGSPAGMCGNGARCLARYARHAGLTSEPLAFDVNAGRYSASVPGGEGEPVRLFVPSPENFRPQTRLADGRHVPYVWTGTHHVVLFVDEIEAVDPMRDAPPVRHDPAFLPEGTNVSFVEMKGPQRLAIRTFEKGVEGETLACGTGALAAAVVAHLAGRSSATEFEIHARGGEMKVGFEMEDGSITDLFLEGPAVTVFTGMLEIDPGMLDA